MGQSLAGMVLDGRWSLTERIASGSFASVYRASDQETGTERAVKILTEVATDEAVQRFRAEFATLRRLTHPHVVRCHAVGTVGGRPYMVLDLIAGGNVTTLLEDGPISAERAAAIGVQVLAGLADAHARGVIHRDVKPGNVLVDADGSALVCDFGIARIESEDQVRLTQVGDSLGTLLYMAPEQRLDAHAVDLTADLYGVGCLLYRLVTDESPADLFSAPPASPRWAAVPDTLRSVLIRATRGHPEDRYPDARAMAEALLAVLPPETRGIIERMPACDPLKFPVPDPSVRVGTFAEEPTVPGEPRARSKGATGPVKTAVKGEGAAKAKGATGPVKAAVAGAAGGAGSAGGARKAAAEAGSPWPWRIGVAVLVVVAIGVAGMLLGGCAEPGEKDAGDTADTGDTDTGDTGDTDTGDTGTDAGDTAADTGDTGPVGSLACPIYTPPVDTGVEDCDNYEDDDGDGRIDGEDRSCPMRGRIDTDAADASWTSFSPVDYVPHRLPTDGSLVLMGERDGEVRWFDLCDAMEGTRTLLASAPTGQPSLLTVTGAVADLPDIDGDGHEDLLVSHSGARFEPSLSWVSSAATGSHASPDAIAERTLRVWREVEVGYGSYYAPGRFGRLDADGDGVDEILVVVEARERDTWLQHGAVFLLAQDPGGGTVTEAAQAGLHGDEELRLFDAIHARDLDGDGGDGLDDLVGNAVFYGR